MKLWDCIINDKLVFSYKSYVMDHLTIDNKKYVLVPEENFQELQKAAALKREPEKTFTIEEARAYSKKRVGDFVADDFWHTLPEPLKQAIGKAKTELDNNEGIPHQQVMDEVNRILES